MNEVQAPVDAVEWATAVVAELGAGWSAARGVWDAGDATLAGPDGQTLHVKVGGYQRVGRVEVSWWIDQELTKHAAHREETRKSITMTDRKSATVAAKDITRRLMPGLAEMLATLRDRKQRSDDADARRDAFLAEVADLLCGNVEDGNRWGSKRCPEVGFGRYDHGGTVAPFYDSTAEMKLRLPNDLVLRVAGFVGELLRGAE